MTTTISLDFKTLVNAVNAITTEPVGSEHWNRQFINLFGEEVLKAYQASLVPAKTEEKKGMPGWAKTTCKAVGAVAGLGVVGGLGFLAYQHFKPTTTGSGEGIVTAAKVLKRFI